MNPWENNEPVVLSGTFKATSDFTDWLKELEKTSIAEIDVVGLCDKTTGEKREFIAYDRVIAAIDKELNDFTEYACKNAPNKYEESTRVLMAMALTVCKAAVFNLRGGGDG